MGEGELLLHSHAHTSMNDLHDWQTLIVCKGVKLSVRVA